VAHYVIRIARHVTVIALFFAAAVLGVFTGLLFAYTGDLPQISALDDYAPSTITRVYGSRGEVIGEFATERRVVIGYDQISPRLRQAIIAAEDADFDRHFGLSIPRIAVTLANDALHQRMAGASTLTQQLARNLFPIGFDKTWERKIKEAILTIQIEKRYTKREIFKLYCNQIYLGHGAYGVEAASRLYFEKSAKDLTVEEAALIAGIIQLPERQSPFIDMKRAVRRRNYVLQRMAEERYITPQEAEAAKQKPIVLRGTQPAADHSVAPYFVEEVRKYLERRFGAKQLYEAGLAVYTSLDVDLQVAANKALDDGLRALDKRRGFRKPKGNLVAGGHSVDDYKNERWDRPIEVGDVVPAVVTAIGARSVRRSSAPAGGGLVARLRIGRFHADLGPEGFAWTGRKSPSQLLKAGDLVDVRITKLDASAAVAEVTLEQEPIVEGAVLVLDNRTGQIKAMTGGYSFARSKFNRATQAYRQMGSGFKPIVYTTAIDRGFTPTSILIDAPVAYPAGPGQPVYSPHNYDNKYEGPVTLRHALEESRNVPAVRTMEQIGPKQVVSYARRFGFQGPMGPYLSLALGAAEATLVEVTSAYSVFPNQGVRMRPYQILKIVDRDGNLLEEDRPEAHDAIRADTAFIMTNLLRGVVQRGTGAAAAPLEWPLGGKTGTTDDYGDAWFTGFDPNITVGVWVGLDDKKPLGPNETGAAAALPIWMQFVRAYIGLRGNRLNPPIFEPPTNIVFLPVDRATGVPTSSDAPGAISEAFISGTQPGSGIR
jgi:penicillin-binding protein 1A